MSYAINISIEEEKYFYKLFITGAWVTIGNYPNKF